MRLIQQCGINIVKCTIPWGRTVPAGVKCIILRMFLYCLYLPAVAFMVVNGEKVARESKRMHIYTFICSYPGELSILGQERPVLVV